MIRCSKYFVGLSRPKTRWKLFGKHCVLALLCLSGRTGVKAQSDENASTHRRRLLNSTVEFYSFGSRTFTVPAGVTVIVASLAGARGGTVTRNDMSQTGAGGFGSTIVARIPVTPGELLQIYIGGNGGLSSPGYNGGGAGCTENPNEPSGGGGGATDIRRTPYQSNNRLAVAAGGGGGSAFFGAAGGSGGYPSGQSGGVGIGSPDIPSGGTDSSGGTVSIQSPGACAAAGSVGTGGSCCNGHGGGGGAGYYGGGAAFKAGGGGGSSYVDTASGVELISHEVSSPTSFVIIEYTNFDPTAQPTVSPSLVPTAVPTSQPSSQPSLQPFLNPSGKPSSQPTVQPSMQPSQTPTVQPSVQPTGQPSVQPTVQPTPVPSSQPSMQPSSAPSAQPSGLPSSQPSIQPSRQPSLQPTCLPSSQPSSCPTTQPSDKPTSAPTSKPSNQPSSLPSSQPSITPSLQPSGQPSVSPTSKPTQLLTSKEYAHIVDANISSHLKFSMYINDEIWGCGSGDLASVCLTLTPSGIFISSYRLPWNHITSILGSTDSLGVTLSGLNSIANAVSTDIALCEIEISHLLCAVKTLPDIVFLAGSFAPTVNKFIFVGAHSGSPSVSFMNTDSSGAVSVYRYANNLAFSISVTNVKSLPNFVGSFVAGTCTTSGSDARIFAGMVRTDTGAMTSMCVGPASSAITNSVELVNAMALEFTRPDSFIGGGILTTGQPGVSAYYVCVNALYQSVRYGRRFRIIPQVAQSDSRRLAEVTIPSSVVKSLLSVDTSLYVLISWNASRADDALNRISVVKMDAFTGEIVQQVHLISNIASLYCLDMSAAGQFITLVCTMRYSASSMQSVLISVDRLLTFSELPASVVKLQSTIFASDVVLFQRTIIPMSVENTAITTADYTFNTMDGNPTEQPSIMPTTKPTVQPSSAPSGQPSSSPTSSPSISPQPTSQPSTSGPTNTYKPTIKPSLRPTPVPSKVPTVSPTQQPSLGPTVRPTVHPSRNPTTRPSAAPAIVPSRAPQSRPTLKPTTAPTVVHTSKPSLNAFAAGLVSKPVNSSTNVNQSVMILLYVLGGLTTLYGIYRLYLCYGELVDDFAWKRKMEVHRKQILLSVADQPTHIPNLARRLATYKIAKRSIRDTIIQVSNLRTTETSPVCPLSDHKYIKSGASIDIMPTNGAYANGAEINSPSLNTAYLNTISEEASTMNPEPLCEESSSASSSFALSSLHSSEMSDMENDLYSTGY